MPLIRLQKYISECGYCSRRKAEELIQAGRVKVNNQKITVLGTKIDSEEDEVAVNGQILRPKDKYLLAFHKPIACITSKSDPDGRKTVYDYLPAECRQLITIGRLDYNTTGLLLLTNDGDFCQALSHPSADIARVYQVTVRGVLSRDVLNQLNRQVVLEDGPVKPLCEILSKKQQETELKLTLTEGRNRIVRRLMQHFNHPVKSLSRISFGPFHLGNLAYKKFYRFKPEQFDRYRELLVKSK